MKKKIFLLLAIVAALTLVFVACTDEPEVTAPAATDEITDAPTDEITDAPTDEPTDAPTAAPTDAPTAAPTDAPTEPATLPYAEPEEAGMVGNSFDTFYVNGNMYFAEDGKAGEKLAAIDDTIAFKTGEEMKSMMLRGWIGFDQAIDSFGYYVDTYDFIYDAAFTAETDEDVKKAGGQYASRFEITVPLTGLSMGDHAVGFIVKLADGTVVLLRTELTVGVEKTVWQHSGIVGHLSLDALYYAENNRNAFFYEGHPGTWNYEAKVPLGTETLTYWGWVGYMGELGQFGYQIDGGKAVFNDEWTYVGPDHDNVVAGAQLAGAESGNRMKIAMNVAGLEGAHTITVLYKNAEGACVVLSEFKLIAPRIFPEATVGGSVNAADQFGADAAADAKVDAKDSLSTLFTTVTYGAAEVQYVKNGEIPQYNISSFTEAFVKMDGTYVYSMHSISSQNKRMASYFIRGAQSVKPLDTTGIQNVLNNYYETDGQDSGHAGAGIQFWNHSKLMIGIKYYDPDEITKIGTAYWLIQTDTKNADVQIIDNGAMIYVTVNGNLVATIELVGEGKKYDGLQVTNDATFCEKALVNFYVEVSDAYGNMPVSGGTYVINNTLVVDTPASDVGLATRTGTLNFTSLSLAPLSSVEIPEIPEKETVEGDPRTFSVCCDNVRTWVGDEYTDLCTQEAHLYMASVNNRVSIDGLDYVSFRGWANPTVGGIAIDQFGYRINGGEDVFSPDFLQDEPELKAALNSDYAERYENIKIPVADLAAGSYEVTLLVRDTNGVIYVMNGSWGGTITLVKA